jgi:hypothetical protein
MASKIFLAPGLLAHIRKSVIEGVQADELVGRDSHLNELVQHHYVARAQTAIFQIPHNHVSTVRLQ